MTSLITATPFFSYCFSLTHFRATNKTARFSDFDCYIILRFSTTIENIAGALDHFGAHDSETSIYKLFARWVYALGNNKLKFNPAKKKGPPPAV